MMHRPNILIFMTDQQRADTVTPGHPCITPNLERFAREGVTFRRTYCPTPHCCPSRATFLSGLYPSRHGVWNNVANEQALSRGFLPGVRTWADDLKAAGYAMAWSGKWHVSVEETPRDRGFRELTAIPGRPPMRWDVYKKRACRDIPARRGEGEILRPGYGTYRTYRRWETGREHPDALCVQSAVAALPELAASGRPWCLYVGTFMPHDPYVAPVGHLDRYDLQDVPLPKTFDDPLTDKPVIVRRMRRQIWGQLTAREVREAIRHYWASCTYLDDLFARLLCALEKTGQAEDTLVLYCSDHGDYLGEHGIFAKGIPCYNGAYHVPAIVRWPKGIEDPGRDVDAFVSLADFAPTLTEVSGGRPVPNLTGKSLTPFFRGVTPGDWRREIATQCNGVELYYTQRSIMTGSYKYVFNGFDHDELYDLQHDPDELHNLAGQPSYDAIKRDMCRRMWRFAHREKDVHALNDYITTGLAPYGPSEAFR